MTQWTPYSGDRYLDFDELTAWCQALQAAHPAWVKLEEAGQSRQGRPIWLLTLTAQTEGQQDRPGFWLDAGTHASEFTGVSAALYAASRWVEALAQGQPEALRWFSRNAVHLMPCISPDGFDAMCKGEPFLRSSLRPPREGQARHGLEQQDLDGDGAVRWMRWRHPAGPLVQDEEQPLLMRRRTLEDKPQDAFFMAVEGLFLDWDGVRWVQAPRRYGLDLNRNFPGSWAPFSMFGMDGGLYPLSEPESRAAVEAVAARPFIAAALTNHTYTGCLLTQPYRDNSPLGQGDIDLMEALAQEATRGTGYRVFKVHPEFTYDPKAAIVGVWADTLATVFGIPGYTLELWDPLAWAGVDHPKPLDFLMRPDLENLRSFFGRCAQEPALVRPWKPFDHPQLGPVEIGGLEYLRTVRNPPEALLAKECEKGFQIADRLRRSLPQVQARLTCQPLGESLWSVTLVLENQGYLSTEGLAHGAQVGACPATSARISLPPGARLVQGQAHQTLEHLQGWGVAGVSGVRNPIYPSLGARGHRAAARWLIQGEGEVQVTWTAGRAGRATLCNPLVASEISSPEA